MLVETRRKCQVTQFYCLYDTQEERVLFHYSGHGVPRPTVNGEIWVFNKVSYMIGQLRYEGVYCVGL